ncbi:MAG: AI-2E family transporter [Bryobacteraceae bacterium]
MTTLSPTLPARKPANLSVTVLAFAACIVLLYFGRVFFITLLVAGIIAFLLDPVVMIFVKLRLPRPVSSFIVCSIALFAVYLAGLGMYTEFAGLAEDLPAYSQRLNTLVDSAAAKIDGMEKSTIALVVPKRFQQQDPRIQNNSQPNVRKKKGKPLDPAQPQPIPEVRIHPEPAPLWTYVYAYLVSFYDVLLMASFIPFLVYFMLSWRDHLRRSFLYLFSGTQRQVVGKAWEGIAHIARGYVIGNFLLGLLLGGLSCLFFFIIRLPYWPIIGPISGFLSLVPYAGLPLAIVPPLIAGLAVYDQPAIYIMIAVVVAILHLTALNLLYPKIVGSRVHLNPLIVTIALMFWGTLWGGIGLLLAIPITAGIKAVFDNVTGLQGYGKLLGEE